MTGSWYPVSCDLAMDPVLNENSLRQPFKEQRVPGEYGYTQVWEVQPLHRPTSVAAQQARRHLASGLALTESPHHLLAYHDVTHQMEQVYDRTTLDGNGLLLAGNTKCFCGQDSVKMFGRESPPPPPSPPLIQISQAEDKLQSPL